MKRLLSALALLATLTFAACDKVEPASENLRPALVSEASVTDEQSAPEVQALEDALNASYKGNARVTLDFAQEEIVDGITFLTAKGRSADGRCFTYARALADAAGKTLAEESHSCRSVYPCTGCFFVRNGGEIRGCGCSVHGTSPDGSIGYCEHTVSTGP